MLPETSRNTCSTTTIHHLVAQLILLWGAVIYRVSKGDTCRFEYAPLIGYMCLRCGMRKQSHAGIEPKHQRNHTFSNTYTSTHADAPETPKKAHKKVFPSGFRYINKQTNKTCVIHCQLPRYQKTDARRLCTLNFSFSLATVHPTNGITPICP